MSHTLSQNGYGVYSRLRLVLLMRLVAACISDLINENRGKEKSLQNQLVLEAEIRLAKP